MSTRIRPLGDRIVVRRVTADERTPGGIIVPDAAREKPIEGEVVAVGPGRITEHGQRIEPDVKVGDRVLFGKYGGTEVKIDGEERLILREDEIFVRLETVKQ